MGVPVLGPVGAFRRGVRWVRWVRGACGSQPVRRRAGGTMAAVVVASSLVAVAAAVPAAQAAGMARPDSSVPTFRTKPLAARPVSVGKPKVFNASSRPWPTAGRATVALPASASGTGTGKQAGGLPVRVAPAGGGSGVGAVEASVEARSLADRLGVAGLVVGLRGLTSQGAAASGVGSSAREGSRTRVVGESSWAAALSGKRVTGAGTSTAGSGSRKVTVGVDYAGVAAAFGGGWASRARLVSLPACALTDPGRAGCRTVTPLASSNDVKAQRVSAVVPVSASRVSVLAAVAGSSGSTGDFKASDLKPSGSWNAGGSSGGFTYSYPVGVPPVPGGPTPSVSLDYDSQSVDGQQVATNTQSSWIGDGWDYAPGSIERSYAGCSELPVNPVKKKGDLCWSGQVVNLSFGSHSGALVHDTSTPTGWRLENEDDTRVELLTGASNSARNGEHWKLTTADGTQYFFGRNRLPGYAEGKATTNSVFTVPVYGAHAGDPCYSADGFASSVCDQAWRWNLDWVVSTHGGGLAYYWSPEQNYYASDVNATTGKGTLRRYVRGGTLARIDYGLSSSDPYGAAPAQVVFTTNERCVKGAETSGGECDPGRLGSKSANWPDVPWDQNCFSSATGCTVYSPTFWTRKRLTKIATRIRSGEAWRTVDQFSLSSTLLDPGDGTASPLWLSGIGRVAGVADEAITVPKVEFGYALLPNRVDALDSAPAMNHPRITRIITESGENIGVQYQTVCKAPVTVKPQDANSTCYPVNWTREGYTEPTLDWFHKYRVVQIDDQDTTGGAPTAITRYQYLGGAGWHYDDNELVKAKHRTYGQFRGYGRVQTLTGETTGPQTLHETIYYRGMDDDRLPDGGKRTATVSLADGLDVPGAAAAVPDEEPLAGQVRQDLTWTGKGGSLESSMVHDYWASPALASRPRTGLSPLVSRRVKERVTTGSQAVRSSGTTTWRTTQTQTSYDPATGLVEAIWARGDLARDDDSTCTTTTYAPKNTAANILGLPTQVEALAADCAGSGVNALRTPTDVTRAKDTISATRTFYDTTSTTWPQDPPTRGDVTRVQTAEDHTGSAYEYLDTARTTVDSYGRPVKILDAQGHTTTTSYTETGGLTTGTSATNALGHTASTTLDPARGLTLTQTDANKLVTTSTYDALGRLTSIRVPGQRSGDKPQYSFEYTLSRTAAAVVSKKLRENGLGHLWNITLYDSLLRERQTQSTAVTDSERRLVTDVFYDSHGWAVKNNGTYVDATGAPSTVLAAAPADNQLFDQTKTTYDTLGRPTATIAVSRGAETWRTTTVHGGDRTTVIPPKGGTTTATVADALGRTTRTLAYRATPAVQGSAVTGGDPVVTSFAYDRRGLRASVTDADGNRSTDAYDLLGRVTAHTDPDAGTSTSRYDVLGQVVRTEDSAGRVLQYAYDALGRKTATYAGSVSPESRIASWEYDTASPNGVGQPASSTSYSEGYAYEKRVAGYTARYQPTKSSVTIPADPANGKTAGTYTTSYSYTPVLGQLSTEFVPSAGGLASDEVEYGYNGLGLIMQYGGWKTFVTTGNSSASSGLGVVYDDLWRPVSIALGDLKTHGKELLDYDQQTGAVVQAQVRHDTDTTVLSDVRTAYDQVGNVTSRSTIRKNATGSTSVSEQQCYAYDGLSRLTGAWTATTDCAQTPTGQGTATGPSGYWTTWEYNATAGRTGQVQHQVPGTPTAPGDVETTYEYADPAHPHAATRATATGPAGTSTQALEYDSTGSTIRRTTTGTVQGLPWLLPDTPTGTGTGTGTGTVAGTGPTVAKAAATPTGSTTGSVTETVAGAPGTTGSGASGSSGTGGLSGSVLSGVWGGSGAVGVQVFSYGPTGALGGVSTGAEAGTAAPGTELVRDADGGLLVQRSPAQGQVIAYLGSQEAQWDRETDTLTGRRYYTLGLGGVSALRTGNGAGEYQLLVSDAQGTGSITLDPGGQKASFRDYTPYGQVRAQAQAGAVSGGGVDPATAWTDPHQYLGLPVDPATGLNLLGARQYDPALGSFLQLDPVLEPGDPSQIGGYTYAGSDPVNGTDPTGLCVARYDDGALCTDGTIPGTGYTPTEYRQRTDKHRKQPPTGDRTDTTPGTSHRGGGQKNNHWWNDLGNTISDTADTAANTLDPYARSIGHHLPDLARDSLLILGGATAVTEGFAIGTAGCVGGLVTTGVGVVVTCPAAVAVGATTATAGTITIAAGAELLTNDLNTAKNEAHENNDGGGTGGEKSASPLDIVPEGASKRVLKPHPGAGSQEGVEFKWVDEGGQTVRLRVHGPDGTAPPGSNSASGNTYRIQVGGRYQDAEGNLYSRNAHNPNSPNYDPTAANATHIPWPSDIPLPW